VPNGDIDGFVAAVRRLYQNRGELKECGARAIAAVQERFTLQAVGRQYHELIGELLGQRKTGNAA
jgi:glycosyltransferase involved in cell wall biosynthesis